MVHQLLLLLHHRHQSSNAGSSNSRSQHCNHGTGIELKTSKERKINLSTVNPDLGLPRWAGSLGPPNTDPSESESAQDGFASIVGGRVLGSRMSLLRVKALPVDDLPSTYYRGVSWRFSGR